jgi:hypothetical protein
MEPLAPIQYRDFWDVPRIFIASYEGKSYLFDCPFDEATEDYPNIYKVFILPELPEATLAGSWDELHTFATQYLGDVPIDKVGFDPTHRHGIHPRVLEELAALVSV